MPKWWRPSRLKEPIIAHSDLGEETELRVTSPEDQYLFLYFIIPIC
jgi:hypothetical protein